VHFRLNVPGQGLVAGEAVLRWTRSYSEDSQHLSGAQIVHLHWGHTSKWNQYLGILGGRLLSSMDVFLMAACVVLGLLILQGKYYAFASAWGQTYLTDLFLWLPQAGIIAVSLLGIYLLIKSK
jgi:hypothetical protein